MKSKSGFVAINTQVVYFSAGPKMKTRVLRVREQALGHVKQHNYALQTIFGPKIIFVFIDVRIFSNSREILYFNFFETFYS